MNLMTKIEMLLDKTNNAIEPYLSVAVDSAIASFTESMAQALRAIEETPKATNATLKPTHAPTKISVPRGSGAVPTPYIDILNFIRKHEGEHLRYGDIADAISLPKGTVKSKLTTMRTKGIVRTEGSTKSHMGFRYYISRDRAVLSNLAG